VTKQTGRSGQSRHCRAVQAAQTITNPGWQAQSLADLARVAPDAGDLNRARTGLARQSSLGSGNGRQSD
jgi:hypothetical protein